MNFQIINTIAGRTGGGTLTHLLRQDKKGKGKWESEKGHLDRVPSFRA